MSITMFEMLGHEMTTDGSGVVVTVTGAEVVTVGCPAIVVAMVGGNVVVPPAATRINAMLFGLILSTYGKTPADVNLKPTQ